MQNDLNPTLNWSFRNHEPIGDMELRFQPVTGESGYLIRRPADTTLKPLKMKRDKPVVTEDLTYGLADNFKTS